MLLIRLAPCAAAAAIVVLATAGPAALAQTPVTGTSRPCDASALISTGTGPAATLTACNRAAREAPGLAAALEQLNAVAARDEDTRRDLQRFGATLNDMSRRLQGPNWKNFAEALAVRIERSAARGNAALVNEIDRLRVSLRETNQKLDEVRSRPGLQQAADGAMAGEAGQAVARLDFDAVRSLLDGLEAVRRDVADAQGPYAANATLYDAARREALERLEHVQRAGGATRCAKGMASLQTLRTAAEDLQRSGKVNASGLTYKDLFERAVQIANELSVLDSLENVRQSSAQQRSALERQSAQRAYDFAGMTFDRRRAGAARMARTEALRGRIGEADAMRTRAAELAQRGQLLEAADLLVDGANLLGRIESDAGNYRVPLDDIPKAHRMMTGHLPPVAAPAINESDVLGAGALCR